jgi:predicted permease
MSDFRYALRQLTRSPGFTIVAALTLAIGIGANTALFSLANAILARPLAEVRDADRLVWVSPVTRSGQPMQMSYPAFLAYRDQAGPAFTGMAATANGNFAVATDGGPVRANGAYVSASYFSVLGTRMLRGRGFAVEEDRSPGGNPVAIIGERMWRERFAAAEDIVGRSVMINGRAFSIVGVTPAAFNGHVHSERLDLWLPVSMAGANTADRTRLLTGNAAWLTSVGRLGNGVSFDAASAAVAAAAARLHRSDSTATRDVATAKLFPASTGMRPNDMQDVGPIASLAGAVTLLVLLIACANVSNLLLARAAGRRREIGVRLSIGASRARVVRQLLSESLLLSLLGASAGFLIAMWATAIMASIFPAPLNVTPDARVLGFTILAAAATSIAFGVVPALHATRADLAAILREAVTGFDRRRSRLQGGFVIAQLSLSLVLLAMAGMFLGSLYKASRLDVHFDSSERVLAASMDLSLNGYDSVSGPAFVRRARAAAAAIPGARSVTLTDVPPMGRRSIGVELFAAGKPAPFGTASRPHGHDAYYATVDVDYFRTVGIRLTSGREFNANDVPGSTQVAIISERYAHMIWSDTNPVGRRIRIDSPDAQALTIVGVAGDALTMGISEQRAEPLPMVYRPLRQRPGKVDLTILVRADADARPLAAPLRAALQRIDANVPLTFVQTLADYRRSASDESRLGSTLLAIFGGLALLLATVGIYAVMAFSVSQRRREIGVRVALGAAGAQIVRLFVRQGLRLAAAGIAIGLVLAGAAGQLLSSMFFGVSIVDAVPVVAVALVLAAAALVASWIPARRAARIDPMAALRAD